MRIISAITLFLLSQLAFAQLVVKPILSQNNKSAPSTHQFRQVEPATLPFWDDFSISNTNVDSVRIWGNNTTSQWDYEKSKNVFVNTSLAINPPTYKVVTFDGLDANGAFHQNDTSGLADQLQSRTIDLSSYEEKDSIYFSFYWQAGGNVENPDEGDSIRLQFYNPENERWTSVWKEKGGDPLQDSLFTHKVIKVKTSYLTSEFAFRFQSFGDLNGPFDAWHLDWVYLNEGRTIKEEITGYEDRSLSGQLSSPITPFSSIPIHQFTSDNKYVQNQEIGFSFLNTDLNTTSSFFQIISTYQVSFGNMIILNDPERSSGIQLEAPLNYITQILGTTDLTRSDSLLANQDFSFLLGHDSVVLNTEVFIKRNSESFQFLDNTQIDLTINDTVRQQYLLHDYYAFDDGTAEYAAGTNILNGQIAVKFWLEEQDTLTHVAFHFPNVAPSADGKPLTLNIFEALNDSSLALRSQQINVKSDSIINGFTYYELSRPLVLSDTFYISYQQSTNDYIGIGFDRSNMEASQYIFENKGDGWVRNTSIEGALMIRPVFKPVKDFTLGERIKLEKLTIYPNPTKGMISINGHYLYIELRDISGKIIISEKNKEKHNFSNLKAGLYLLRVHQLDGERTYKIIKK